MLNDLFVKGLRLLKINIIESDKTFQKGSDCQYYCFRKKILLHELLKKATTSKTLTITI